MTEQVSLTGDEELEIALLLMEGKADALFRLLEALAPKAKQILLSKFAHILTDADIDDVLLLAAQRAVSAAGHFDERRGHLGGWFYGIAYRAAIDRMRKLGGKPTVPLGDDAPASASDTPEDEPPIDETTRVDLLECVGKLGELQRKIIEADLLAGVQVDAEALSRKLGIPKQHVYSYREKAHRALEKCMAKRGHTAETTRSRQ